MFIRHDFLRMVFSLCLIFFLSIAPVWSNPVIYDGEGGGSGIGKGKHIVFIASDHEYRSEETCPALARILAKHHGFKCTVLFGLDANGYIKAGASNVPGMETLKDADGLMIFTRFLNLPDEQMVHLDDYLKRGGPISGLRTSSHGFNIKDKDRKYHKYHFRYGGEDFKNGFGERILGNTWEGHYGRNHKQMSKLEILPQAKGHVILTGVNSPMFCFAGGYDSKMREGITPLTQTQPLTGYTPDSPNDESKPPKASTWTYHYDYTVNGEVKKARAFHSTQGASEDILDENYRRMLINGMLWAFGLEDMIQADLEIAFVGPYKPGTYRMRGEAPNVKPAELNGFESPIMPERERRIPVKKKKK